MLEKAITVTCVAFGAALGVGLAEASVRPGEPHILSMGKDLAGGVIFGVAGLNASKQLIPMLPTVKKGD